MAQNPPVDTQRVIPYLVYRDAPAALEFLVKAFGFEERFRMAIPGGKLGHAELGYGDNALMLASALPENHHASPSSLPARHGLVVIYVDDVDAHHTRARAAGAEILQAPEDQFYGDRTYRARDPEGHEWSFHTHVRDVPHEELKPPGS